MRALGFQVKKAEIRQLIADIDKDESGSVNLDEFIEMMTGKMVRVWESMSLGLVTVGYGSTEAVSDEETSLKHA